VATVGDEWDPAKDGSNLDKHGGDFADAVVALEDLPALTIRHEYRQEEQRFITMCVDPSGRTFVVVYTWRSEKTRIIPAREATPKERRDHEGGQCARSMNSRRLSAGR
jgi:uncharacterized DUF497 family protein